MTAPSPSLDPQQPALASVPVEAAPTAAMHPSTTHRRSARHTVGWLFGSDVAALTAFVWITGSDLAATSAVSALVVIVVLSLRGFYYERFTRSVLDDLPTLASAVVIATAVSLLAVRPEVLIEANWGAIALLMAAAVTGLAVIRLLAYAAIRTAERRGLVARRTLVVGSTDRATQLVQALVERAGGAPCPIGYLGDPDADLGWPVTWVGDVDDLVACVAENNVDLVLLTHTADVIGSYDDLAQARLSSAIQACLRVGVDVYAIPGPVHAERRGRDLDQLWGIPLIRVRSAPYSVLGRRIKRSFDFLVAAVLLILMLPMLIAIGIGLRMTNGPGVIFRQVRVGLDGQPFTLLKFRTLRHDHGAVAVTSLETWSIADHPGLGPLSRFLRSSSLDELPQLINVLRGEMSLVGPRPERVSYVEQFAKVIPRYQERHRMPVGLTGWAQINGLRGDTSIPDRVRFDNYYIANWSLWLDLKIILRTFISVLSRHGS